MIFYPSHVNVDFSLRLSYVTNAVKIVVASSLPRSGSSVVSDLILSAADEDDLAVAIEPDRHVLLYGGAGGRNVTGKVREKKR